MSQIYIHPFEKFQNEFESLEPETNKVLVQNTPVQNEIGSKACLFHCPQIIHLLT